MASLFIALDDNSIFQKSAGTTASLVSCSLTDDIAGLNSSILTNVTVNYNETVQFFQTFDDLIHYFYFGQGLGSIRFEVMCFQDCSGSAPGFQKIVQTIGQNRGKAVTLNMGTIQVEGILTDFTVSLTADPVPIYTICATLGMTNNGLPKPSIDASC